MWTCAGDVAICQKGGGLFIIILLRSFLDENPLVIQSLKKLRGRFMVNLIGGSGVDIKGDPKIFKGLFVDGVITIHHILWRGSLFPGFQGDGHSMFIRSANGYHIPVPLAQVSHVDIRGHIDAGQVAQVKGPIGIRQGRGNQVSFIFSGRHIEVCLGPHKDNHNMHADSVSFGHIYLQSDR
jgi:hypothetical protein